MSPELQNCLEVSKRVKIFILTVIAIFLPILIESMSLILQLKNKKLTRWFGKNAFNIHAMGTAIFWIIAFFSIAILQFEKHPLFHNNTFLKYTGLILLILGIVLALWAFSLLGLKRTLCINFFESYVPIVKTSLYGYIKNPMDIGLWVTFIGFAFFTRSIYNLIIAIEFVVIMIPHIMLENIPL